MFKAQPQFTRNIFAECCVVFLVALLVSSRPSSAQIRDADKLPPGALPVPTSAPANSTCTKEGSTQDVVGDLGGAPAVVTMKCLCAGWPNAAWVTTSVVTNSELCGEPSVDSEWSQEVSSMVTYYLAQDGTRTTPAACVIATSDTNWRYYDEVKWPGGVCPKANSSSSTSSSKSGNGSSSSFGFSGDLSYSEGEEFTGGCMIISSHHRWNYLWAWAISPLGTRELYEPKRSVYMYHLENAAAVYCPHSKVIATYLTDTTESPNYY